MSVAKGKNVKKGVKGFQETTPTKPVVPTAAKKVMLPVDRNPVRNQTDINKLKLIQMSSVPNGIPETFPRNMDLLHGLQVYNKVAESMLAFEGDLSKWRFPKGLTPRYGDLVGIWTEVSNLGIWNSRDIQHEVADRGEAVKNLEETLMGYLNEMYEWAYDSLMDYIGGYSYVTNEYGAWGKWVKQGTPVDKKDLVFDSPAAKRAEWQRRQQERNDAHNARVRAGERG